MSSHLTSRREEQAALETVPRTLYIGGEWLEASGGATLTVVDPATEEGLVEVADAQAQDALAALGAAAEVQQGRSGPPRRLASEARSCDAHTRRSSSGLRSSHCS